MLEDRILTIFETLQGSSVDNEAILPLVEEFNENSSYYQNRWTEEFWKIYNYKRKVYEERIVNSTIKVGINKNKSIIQADISFDELNEKDFLENNSFLSINNENFLLTSDLGRKSTNFESKIY